MLFHNENNDNNDKYENNAKNDNNPDSLKWPTHRSIETQTVR